MQPFTDLSEIGDLSRSDFETACKANTSYIYLGNSVGICQILTRHKVVVDTRDFGVVPHFIIDGFWESWVTQFIATVVKPGDVCIDIGANFGYYSILMAQLTGEGGKTIAVEPNPGIAKLLRFTANLQPRSFSVVETALSGKAGIITLNVPENYFGSASVLKGLSRKFGRAKAMKVPVTTLDQMVQKCGLSKVDVIKMDVEGIEPLVFDGMKSVLANNPEVKIIVEYTPEAYKDARQFTRYLCDHFEVQRIWGATHLEKLDVDDIERMITQKDHIDLFLKQK